MKTLQKVNNCDIFTVCWLGERTATCTSGDENNNSLNIKILYTIHMSSQIITKITDLGQSMGLQYMHSIMNDGLYKCFLFWSEVLKATVLMTPLKLTVLSS